MGGDLSSKDRKKLRSAHRRALEVRKLVNEKLRANGIDPHEVDEQIIKTLNEAAEKEYIEHESRSQEALQQNIYQLEQNDPLARIPTMPGALTETQEDQVAKLAQRFSGTPVGNPEFTPPQGAVKAEGRDYYVQDGKYIPGQKVNMEALKRLQEGFNALQTQAAAAQDTFQQQKEANSKSFGPKAVDIRPEDFQKTPPARSPVEALMKEVSVWVTNDIDSRCLTEVFLKLFQRFGGKYNAPEIQGKITAYMLLLNNATTNPKEWFQRLESSEDGILQYLKTQGIGITAEQAKRFQRFMYSIRPDTLPPVRKTTSTETGPEIMPETFTGAAKTPEEWYGASPHVKKVLLVRYMEDILKTHGILGATYSQEEFVTGLMLLVLEGYHPSITHHIKTIIDNAPMDQASKIMAYREFLQSLLYDSKAKAQRVQDIYQLAQLLKEFRHD